MSEFIAVVLAYGFIAFIFVYFATKLDDFIEFHHIIRLFFLLLSMVFITVLAFVGLIYSEQVSTISFFEEGARGIFTAMMWVMIFLFFIITLILLYVKFKKQISLLKGRPEGEEK